MEKIFGIIDQYSMFPSPGTVVVGFSGGADSVCLTHFLKENEDTLGIKVTALHINHMLRGSEADRDEQFCKDFCDFFNIPFKSVRIDVGALARRRGMGTEECAREVRYMYFDEQGVDYIATAHTLSDNAETVIMNLMRGAGLNGVCGIPPVRGNVVRPLIGITREEVLEYNSLHGLKFVTDSTNGSDDYTRNKVRHRVIPEMLSINSSFYTNLTKFLDNVNVDRIYLNSLAKQALDDCREKDGYDSRKLSQLPSALKRRVISAAVTESTGTVPERKHILELEQLMSRGGEVQINGGFTVRVQGGRMYLPDPPRQMQDWIVRVQPGDNSLPFGILTAEIKKFDGIKPCSPDLFRVDSDKLNDELFARNRQPSDSYKIGGRHVTKSLKKLFNEMKIPAVKRCEIPVFVCGGKVIGVLGSNPIEDMMVTSATKTVLEVRLYCYDE